MPAPLFISGPCEVCGQLATGHHFGVLSCRACGAFFRRSATWTQKKALCPKENCPIFADGKFQCKKCRLKRCIDVGMDVNKFQSNRDLISSSNRFSKRAQVIVCPPRSLSSFLGRPSFILCCEPEKAGRFRTFIDASHLLDSAKEFFEMEPSFPTPYQYHNSLEKLVLTLDNMRMKEPEKKLKMIKFLGKNESVYIWEQAFLRVAQWFANFPEFQELDIFVKIEIVKSVWLLWVRLEKMAETADHQRRKTFGSSVFMCGDNTCLDLNSYEVDLSWCTNYSLEQLAFYQMPDLERNFRNCVDELIDLAPTNTELNYMLLQLSLYHAGKRAQGKILESCEKLMELQANNLHEYYTKKMKTPNYSRRLTRLMKINRAVEADLRDRSEKNKIAQLFDIITVDFSHPEMFEAT